MKKKSLLKCHCGTKLEKIYLHTFLDYPKKISHCPNCKAKFKFRDRGIAAPWFLVGLMVCVALIAMSIGGCTPLF